MKQVSPKRAALNAAVEPYRQSLRQRVGKCEWCINTDSGLIVHEIARGQFRADALDKPFATLVLCAACHQDLHELPAPHAVCIGLALLRYSRPEDFNIERFYQLTARRWPSEELISRWWTRTLAGRTRNAAEWNQAVKEKGEATP